MDQRETLDWLKAVQVERFEGSEVKVSPRMTNSDYRRLNNTTTVEATRELRGLVDLKLIEMHGTRRWAYYTLVVEAGVELEPADRLAPLVLDYVREHGSITNRECRDLLGWKEEKRGKAYRLLSRLVREGKLRREGHGRGTRYAHL